MSRAKILTDVLNNQPEGKELPAGLTFEAIDTDLFVAKFKEALTLIGGRVVEIDSIKAIDEYISTNFKVNDEKIALFPGLSCSFNCNGDESPHQFLNTEFAVFRPHFAVAENGAVWLTEDQMGHRVLPFITQHIGILVFKDQLVANMHEAYERIALQDYGFGTFIAGPSKTADIEQSLVLGAHGPRSMTVFYCSSDESSDEQ